MTGLPHSLSALAPVVRCLPRARSQGIPGAGGLSQKHASDALYPRTVGADGEPRASPAASMSRKQILAEKGEARAEVMTGSRRARGWKRPEQLLEAMAAFSRMDTEQGPLQIYLMLNEMDSGRAADKRLAPETVLLLARKFPQLSNWYLVFSEFPDLDDTSITQFVKGGGHDRRNARPQPPRQCHGECCRRTWGSGKFWPAREKFAVPI